VILLWLILFIFRLMQSFSAISDLQRNIIWNLKSKRNVQNKGKHWRLKMYNL
jgi:hypothetical protein